MALLTGIGTFALFVLSRSGRNVLLPATAIDWTTVDLDSLTPAQMLDYFSWPNHSSCGLIKEFGGVVVDPPTGMDGQKAVCMDRSVAPRPMNCLVYSFGINNEWSFDEAMEDYGCQVLAFDPSMNVDDHDHSAGIHFYNIGIGGADDFNEERNWTIRALSTIYTTLASARHGRVPIDYLKMDVEIAEIYALPQIIESKMLDNVRQMGVEIHLTSDPSLEELRTMVKILRAVELEGMVRFDSKYNPWSKGNLTRHKLTDVYLAYEIAWYNSKNVDVFQS